MYIDPRKPGDPHFSYSHSHFHKPRGEGGEISKSSFKVIE